MNGILGFWRALPTPGRWLLSTVIFNTFGRGLTLPFTVIYLHEARGFDLGFSGLLMSWIAVVALIVTAPSGTLTDRFGARPVLIASCVSMALGCVLLGIATTPVAAVIAISLIGVNFGASWPALNALIASIVDGQLRQTYFGVNFALVNVGIGIGGIVGGFMVDVSDPATFTALFVINAVTALVPAALLLGPLRHVRTHVPRTDAGATADAAGAADSAAPADPAEAAASGAAAPAPTAAPAPVAGYRELLRRPEIRWLSLLSFVAVFIGYGQFEAGFPAYARGVAEVSTQVIGFAFALNTAVIVLLQFTVLSRIAGHRRTRVMLVMAGVWALSWGMLGVAGLLPGSVVAAIGVLAFTGVFAFGETLMQPTIPAVVNDLADDRNRGRANAVNASAFQAGSILGPLVAGLLLDRGLDALYLVLMVVGSLAVGACALILERRIPASANGVRAGERVPVE